MLQGHVATVRDEPLGDDVHFLANHHGVCELPFGQIALELVAVSTSSVHVAVSVLTAARAWVTMLPRHIGSVRRLPARTRHLPLAVNAQPVLALSKFNNRNHHAAFPSSGVFHSSALSGAVRRSRDTNRETKQRCRWLPHPANLSRSNCPYRDCISRKAPEDSTDQAGVPSCVAVA